MNSLADENVDKDFGDCLRSDGRTVLYIAEMDPGIDDDAVLFRTKQIGALLITADMPPGGSRSDPSSAMFGNAKRRIHTPRHRSDRHSGG